MKYTVRKKYIQEKRKMNRGAKNGRKNRRKKKLGRKKLGNKE